MLYYSIQLIERFYDPLSGQVLLDNEPVDEFNIQEYRKQLALVSQEPVSKYNIILRAVRLISLSLIRHSTPAPFASISC